MTIYVYDLNNVLVCLFSLCSATRSTPTQVAIAKWLALINLLFLGILNQVRNLFRPKNNLYV